MLNPGDKYTIQGVRVLKNGRWTKRCKPGLETVFTCPEPVKSEDGSVLAFQVKP